MGFYYSKLPSQENSKLLPLENNKLAVLENRINLLEKSIELQHKNISMEYNELLSKKDNQIEELKKQIVSLKSINETLETHPQQSLQIKSTMVSTNELSTKQINAFIDKLLSDKNVNINYLPDFVERQIYKNIFTIIFGLLNNSLETAAVNFLGHKITFAVVPDEESSLI